MAKFERYISVSGTSKEKLLTALNAANDALKKETLEFVNGGVIVMSNMMELEMKVVKSEKKFKFTLNSFGGLNEKITQSNAREVNFIDQVNITGSSNDLDFIYKEEV